MVNVTDQEFEAIVATAIDAIPSPYAQKMNNVGFFIEAEPSPDQRKKFHLHDGQTLYGLYEGIPLTDRSGNYSGVLPDKITIFKSPMLEMAQDKRQLEAIVHDTVWHEVAHHFGLDHGRIHEIQKRSNKV